MNKIKLILKIIACIIIVLPLTSCGSFGEGMLMGLAQAASAYTSTPTYSALGSTPFVPNVSSSSSYNAEITNTSNSGGSNSSTSHQKRCTKASVSDNAHCNGTGTCSRCNGKGKYFDSAFGISKWIDPCITCNGTGKCPACKGTGYR